MKQKGKLEEREREREVRGSSDQHTGLSGPPKKRREQVAAEVRSYGPPESVSESELSLSVPTAGGYSEGIRGHGSHDAKAKYWRREGAAQTLQGRV